MNEWKRMNFIVKDITLVEQSWLDIFNLSIDEAEESKPKASLFLEMKCRVMFGVWIKSSMYVHKFETTYER